MGLARCGAEELGVFEGCVVVMGDGFVRRRVVSCRVELFNSRVVSSLTSVRDSTGVAESVFGKGGAS